MWRFWEKAGIVLLAHKTEPVKYNSDAQEDPINQPK